MLRRPSSIALRTIPEDLVRLSSRHRLTCETCSIIEARRVNESGICVRSWSRPIDEQVPELLHSPSNLVVGVAVERTSERSEVIAQPRKASRLAPNAATKTEPKHLRSHLRCAYSSRNAN